MRLSIDREAGAPAWLPCACKLAALAAVAVALGACCLPQAAHAAAAAAADGAGEGGLVKTVISLVLHLDKHLAALIQQHGTATYALLWAIVFCETGLVLTPFLPGDSLLFAAGAFAGMGQLDAAALFGVFMSSAVLGDAVNYAVGARLGKWALSKQLLNPAHIAQTSKFYAKYGGKTVVLARFVPIVRTFAPFVAGIGSMEYPKFFAYNVFGALVWTVLFVGAGFFFGNLPVVQHNFTLHNFTLVVLGIILISVLPVVFEVIAARREAAAGGGGDDAAPPKAA
ncbi:MAG: snare associated Golgi protein-domain-containing protein [Monoraphidium minutum]|nr:MAG: snare associated Golgi protein-domain-containing protein [Monoraphidium minutum]